MSPPMKKRAATPFPRRHSLSYSRANSPHGAQLEIHRMRAILLRANEPQILIHDDCFVGRDIELLKRVKALRAELKREPVIAE